ncbi:DUF2273 domain-containing protein [Paenibacillus sp. LHD-117]|uniref:DUF2273 domain-containing protein n=1 Tax=Paenibacillus sp. LHD-117 TaxID=3071412 RepID=UPI0027DEC822|nr:DUF2273 domain-containing protein [Paenibacillus sp. LHD-117]MDQ6421046.1 DUF2273 domain-containing protein [Paenibacillus sp. LHD-117]
MWREIWSVYWRRIVGAAAGLLCGIIYLAFGFWDMLFVALLVSAGYWFGKQKELTDGPVIPWQRIWYAIMSRFRTYR